MRKVICLSFVLLILGLVHSIVNVCCANEAKNTPPVNLASGKSYTFSSAPNYSHCTDPGDSTQLTDGKTTKDYFWTQKGTVGWSGVSVVTITFDLGKVEPIDRVSFTSAAGVAGVEWPLNALVSTSEDNKVFYLAGELMKAEAKRTGPFDNTKYSIRKISSDTLATKGRYIQLAFAVSQSFFFTDEVEIFRGDDALMQKPMKGEKIDSVRDYLNGIRTSIRLQNRYSADTRELIKTIQEVQKRGKLDELTANLLASNANTVSQRLCNTLTIPQTTFKTIFPYNDDHARLFALQAHVWKAEYGFDFKAESVRRWERISPMGLHPGTMVVEPKLDLMKGEKRSMAVNLYYTGEEPLDVTAAVKCDDQSVVSSVSFAWVPWTDTNTMKPVQAALVPLAKTDGRSDSFRVWPGLVAQVWITIDGACYNESGDYPFSLIFAKKSGEPLANVDATVKVWPFQFPQKTSLLMGGWDYLNSLPAYNVNQKNVESFLNICRDNHVNAPWANPGAMMKFTFSKDPEPKLTIDTQMMEKWLTAFPNAKEYFVFLSVGTAWGPYKYDTPEFETWVAKWAALWRDWFKGKNIDPSRVNLLVVDEPGLSSAHIESLIAWAKAIKKGAPEFRIWEDPVYTQPTKMPADIIHVSDVLCPNRPQWLNNPGEFEKVYLGAQKSGKTLHFYSCSGPVRMLDPYNYFLLQAWHCYQTGAKASFFWALGDGGGKTSWNEYLLANNAYCPMFIDPNDAVVVSAKQMAAMGESARDYETLVMLRSLIDKSLSDPAKKAAALKAKEQLDLAVQQVLESPGTNVIEWQAKTDRTVTDRIRHQLLELMLSLSK